MLETSPYFSSQSSWVERPSYGSVECARFSWRRRPAGDFSVVHKVQERRRDGATRKKQTTYCSFYLRPADSKSSVRIANRSRGANNSDFISVLSGLVL